MGYKAVDISRDSSGLLGVKKSLSYCDLYERDSKEIVIYNYFKSIIKGDTSL